MMQSASIVDVDQKKELKLSKVDGTLAVCINAYMWDVVTLD